MRADRHVHAVWGMAQHDVRACCPGGAVLLWGIAHNQPYISGLMRLQSCRVEHRSPEAAVGQLYEGRVLGFLLQRRLVQLDAANDGELEILPHRRHMCCC